MSNPTYLERRKALLGIRKQRHENHAVRGSFSLICTKTALLSPLFEIFSEILVQVCYAKAIFQQKYIDNQLLIHIEKLMYVVGFVAWFAYFLLFDIEHSDGNGGVILLFLACTVAFFWFLYAQCAKRCHDLGKSGAWMFVPFWNVLLFFAEGEEQDNQYGQGTATESDHSGNNILWIIFWIVVPIGIGIFYGVGFGNSTSGEIYDVTTADGGLYDSTCVDSTLTDSAYADSTACAYNDAPYYPQP